MPLSADPCRSDPGANDALPGRLGSDRFDTARRAAANLCRRRRSAFPWEPKTTASYALAGSAPSLAQ